MSLKQSYDEWNRGRDRLIFDQESDRVFARQYFGESFNDYCKVMMRELMEIEARLEELEKDKAE